MDLIDGIKSRRSYRKFKPEAVPQNILREILEIAAQAPSSMNTQPWEFFVLAGDILEKVKKANIEKLEAGEEFDEEHNVVGWEKDNKVYRDRQIALAKQLFASMDIAREDKEKRDSWRARGFRFFDAPVGIYFVTYKRTDHQYRLSTAAALENFLLAAHAKGLGTCWLTVTVICEEDIKKHLGISEDKELLGGVALGYPAGDSLLNTFRRTRVPVDEVTSWLGFGEQ